MSRTLLILSMLLVSSTALAEEVAAHAISGKSVFFLMIHVVLAALAVIKICQPGAGSIAWRAIWIFIVVCTPFIGPIFFFGLADPPLRSAADQRAYTSTYLRSMGIRGAGSSGIPFLYDMLTGERDDPPPTADLAPQYRAEVEKGDARAQTCLGTLHEYGDGVKQDDKLAMELYLKAARQGYAAAQLLLAEMYAAGKGTEQNMEEASFWMSLAAKKDPRLKPRLEEFMAKLKPAATVAIVKRATEWTPDSSPRAADITIPEPEPGPTPKPV